MTSLDKQFYENESANYSRKRYEGPLLSYTQFIFRKRLEIFLRMVSSITKNKKNISVFEIGCADGVIIKSLNESFPEIISMTGVDISKKMIQKAQEQKKDRKTSFFLRGDEPIIAHDLVFELGVHVTDFLKEFTYVKTHLKQRGYFIYAAAARTSSHVKFKLKNIDYVKDYVTYSEIEAALAEHFQIIKSVPYGLFVPKLWAIPLLGRIFQPLVDVLLRTITPQLFHEKIYLLKKKD